MFLITLLTLAVACWGMLAIGPARTHSDEPYPPLQDGLSFDFYNSTCPQLHNIVHSAIKPYLDADITQAAGLLRLHFHDCFVQGCDASVLLDGSSSGPSEQSDIPNLTLRPEAFQIINSIKEQVEEQCPSTVSCADIVALAAQESVRKARGPIYPVPLGRRDSLEYANLSVTLANLPGPFENVTGLLSIFNAKGFDTTDLVALSGGHTIGRAHCASFASRLDEPDPNLDVDLVDKLKDICPVSNSTNFTDIDVSTPNRFDNKYFSGLTKKMGLFVSDSSLILDGRTNSTVLAYSSDQILFFTQFSLSMLKMGQLGVLTGTQGEVRKNCSMPNSVSLGILGLSSIENTPQEQ